MAQHKPVRSTARQPQGDFGRGHDHAVLGSSDDAHRHLNEVGAYRGAESPEDDGQAHGDKADGDFGPCGRDFGFGQPDSKKPRPKTPGKR